MSELHCSADSTFPSAWDTAWSSALQASSYQQQRGISTAGGCVRWIQDDSARRPATRCGVGLRGVEVIVVAPH